ncbi:MAG TPA: universal stress protein [Nitrospira sp.]|jgi:nucleotide-binding universal stress UspA family protein|nr:universal stress protein [Nitrospira sp.]
MRMVIGVDWSDEAFAAVKQALVLYRPTEVTIVHGIDLGIFEYPSVAQLASLQGYEGFRWAVTSAGEALLDRTAMTVYSACASVNRINEIGNPARMIVQAAQNSKADLVVVGGRGRSRLAETVLGSVSHRVLMQSPCTTLVVRGESHPVKRVLVAVEGKEDAGRIVQWLKDHPFKDGVDLCILSVVVPLGVNDPYLAAQWESWSSVAQANAADLVKSVAASLLVPAYTVRTRVATGNAAAVIAAEAEGMDLIVAASHGRHGLERFLMGSVSHSIMHRTSGPVLIVH